MAMHSLLHLPKPTFPRKSLFLPRPKPQTQPPNSHHYPKILVGVLGAGLTLAFVGPASASELLPLNEPSNALSLPTWAIHVSSVVECNGIGVAVRGEVRVRILERAVLGDGTGCSSSSPDSNRECHNVFCCISYLQIIRRTLQESLKFVYMETQI
ncbi:uncharacterized protein LOC126626448 isoform X2 [Malus sylvestris]|uniref:uncharacterized protein LOC126626448 isoform X2 n=1 Tax=Malus sylvestris TaxID=3752 RepID=UPI0021ACC5F9|nr:uncharacterized protein LOC126626448 isoform X2 [Malus sylvestris]